MANFDQTALQFLHYENAKTLNSNPEIIPVVSIDYQETVAQNDPDPVVRLYCTQHNQAWKLQLRATGPIKTGGRAKRKPKNLIATATLYREDLIALQTLINSLLK